MFLDEDAKNMFLKYAARDGVSVKETTPSGEIIFHNSNGMEYDVSLYFNKDCKRYLFGHYTEKGDVFCDRVYECSNMKPYNVYSSL